MIRVYYDRGDGFVAIVSSGHAHPAQCAAVGAVLLGAARAIEALAMKFPRQIEFEAMQHGKPADTIEGSLPARPRRA